MEKKVVSIQEVIALNHLLEEKGLDSKIHLHDTCGAQSFSIEALSKKPSSEEQKAVKAEVIAYFEEKGIEILFAQNEHDFYVL